MELADVPAGRQPGAQPPGPGRSGAFALPVSTSFRFALLIAAVAASSFFVYQGIYLATPRGPALISLMLRCRSQALARRPSGVIAYANALHQASVCYSGGERAEAWWGLLGVGLLIVVAGVIFLAQPWWYRRRKHLTELAGADAADLVSRLEGVRQRAGTGPVVWLLQPLNFCPSAFAFGRPRRRFVAISGGAAKAAVREPAAFDAVILHELAHIKNRDIDQTYMALAIWRAFVVAALLPMAVLLIFSRVLGEPQQLTWRVAVMALIVYSLRNAILRSREFDADARARQLDPETALGTVLASQPARTGRRAWHLGWRHPPGRERAAALLDPAPLYRFGFWDGLAIGLVGALGASTAREIVTLMTTTVGIRHVVPALIFAAFAGPALAAAMWRRQLLEANTGVVKGWAAGLGLGLGLALGPVIALSAALNQALAPDHLNPAAVGVLVVWTGLVVVIFTPFPVWVGHWADAWQLGAGGTATRIPARGAMAAATVAAWAIMTIGLYLLLDNFTFIDGTSAVAEWHQLPESLRGTAIVVTLQGAGWVVCLLVAGMPLAATVAHRQWRRPGDAHDGTVRRWLATAVLCLAGCVTAVALMLAVSAAAHARIAEVVRWSPDFVARLMFFDEQAIVVVAVVCALIVAVKARSATSVALSVVAGAAVAMVSGLALPNVRAMDHCFASLSIQYAHPPAGGCLTGPDTLPLRQVVLGAALVSILFVPAAYAAGMLLRRRIRRKRRPVAVVAFGWLVAAVAVIATVAGTALWGPSGSAHGVKPMGSIGSDGWIHGYGYDVRLIPSWYAVTQAGKPGLIYFTFPFDGAAMQLESLVAVNPVKIAEYRSYLFRLGARPDMLDGAPGLLVTYSDLHRGALEQWFVVRGPVVYLITLGRSPEWPEDSPYLRGAFAFMLHSWQWTS
ncbi:MAG: M48 family metalloprotease [Streptosporangiaceae bacterium]|nr:M48 family metalloprotease [Streptosporangiaceae bacterium]